MGTFSDLGYLLMHEGQTTHMYYESKFYSDLAGKVSLLTTYNYRNGLKLATLNISDLK